MRMFGFKRSSEIRAAIFLALIVSGPIESVTRNKHNQSRGESLRRRNLSATNPQETVISINNITSWVSGEGVHFWRVGLIGGDWNGTFPKGTAGVVFSEGMFWGGKVFDGQPDVVRVHGNFFALQPFSAGAIITDATGNVLGRESDDPASVRPYRVRPDWRTADLRDDAANFFLVALGQVTDSQIEQIRTQYEVDWNQWPWQKGAPFMDSNNNGSYEPDIDIPGIPGADQTLWTVYNDLDAERAARTFGSPPIGVEVQETYWAYAATNPLGNVIFKRVRLIYKGTPTTSSTATIDSMYITQLSDTEIGSSTDDLVGSDTTLSLGFAYNGGSVDAIYFPIFGLPPPAVGYDFLQGVIVPGAPTDSALIDFQWRKGFKNLPMTVFTYFYRGGLRNDPQVGSYLGTLQWYNYMAGFEPRPEYPSRVPLMDHLGRVTKFEVTGDPVAGTGDLDGRTTPANPNRFPPGDRRIVLSTGPFTMARGDTQEVVIALVGGLGADFLSSVNVLKFNDRFAQFAYDNLFNLPSPPPTPGVSVGELDKEIILTWDEDPDKIKQIEQVERKGFLFEGYNVYQLPSATATLDQGKKIATFDVINDITVIVDEVIDEQTGVLITEAVQTGGNSGIQRYMQLTEDKIRDAPLVNGQEYYFAVTAYSFSDLPDVPFRSLESVPDVKVVLPQSPKPGVRYEAAFGDTIEAAHISGTSDGSAFAIVVDPTKLTGHTYEVQFRQDTLLGSVWDLVDVTTGETKLSDQTNQTGDDNYFMADGVQWKVFGAPPDFKSFQVVANGAGPIDPPVAGAFDFQGFPTPDGTNPPDEQQVGDGHWAFHTGDDAVGDTSGTRGSFDAFKARSARGDDFDRIVPFDWEMRFTATGSFAVQAFSTGLVVSVPFELWNIGVNTPTDPSDDYQLIPWYMELTVVGSLDPDPLLYQVKPNDHSGSGAANDPFTPWIYWRNPQDTSPGTAGYDAYVASLDFSTTPPNSGTYDFASPEVMARTVLINWNGGDVTDPTWPANVNQLVPEEGTIFQIISTKPNTPVDVFSVTAPDASFNQAQAVTDVTKINVFPNPYFGFNTRELSRLDKYVTFNHLPAKAIIRIFNMGGVLVRVIEKEDPSQFVRWNLRNENNLPVASGIYIVHIEMPDLGATKILKLALVQEEQILRVY